MARRVRATRVAAADAEFVRRPDGSLLVRSRRELGPYPRRITDRLEFWAAKAPERTFLARRNAAGEWDRLTYSETLRRTRDVAQGLIDRKLSPERPVAILSGNSFDHALLALGCVYAGVLYAPLAPAYSLATTDYTTLRVIWDSLEPGLVLAEGAAFGPAVGAAGRGRTEVVASVGAVERTAGAAVDEAHAKVGPNTIAKVLFTSGSTGHPKGVINTQRMWCSNLAMIGSVLQFMGDKPPVLCDWLPWNHTFGGHHNFGLTLVNGGTMYMDDGKPVPKHFGTTVRNLKEIATTAYFNVPKGYEMLVPELRADAELRKTFFQDLNMVFYAAAGLNQKVWDEFQDLAVETVGEEILMVTGLGATETGPSAMFTGPEGAASGRVGLPVPGVTVKLAPVAEKLEVRVKGDSVTPGFWRNEALTRASFDDEGYYCMGDGVTFVDPAQPQLGFQFDGRINEDFKMSSGTWVSVGPLRARFLTHCAGAVQDAVIAGHDRDYVSALLFTEASRDAVQGLLDSFAALSTGASTRIARAMVLTEPPSLAAREITDKGSINQKAVLARRRALVEELYADPASERVMIAGDRL